jgi:hypothetical protein
MGYDPFLKRLFKGRGGGGGAGKVDHN